MPNQRNLKHDSKIIATDTISKYCDCTHFSKTDADRLLVYSSTCIFLDWSQQTNPTSGLHSEQVFFYLSNPTCCIRENVPVNTFISFFLDGTNSYDQISIFTDVTPRSMMDRYQRFQGLCYLHSPASTCLSKNAAVFPQRFKSLRSGITNQVI